jgi:hypothetical protein
VGEIDPNANRNWFWTAPQRRAALILLVIFCVCLAGQLVCNRRFLNDPQPDAGPRANELATHLDPNIATWQELAAIPTLGEARAHSIVTYREKWQHDHPGMPAFAGTQDLRNIRGIGPATVSNMTPYLYFPESKSSPATEPHHAN